MASVGSALTQRKSVKSLMVVFKVKITWANISTNLTYGTKTIAKSNLW